MRWLRRLFPDPKAEIPCTDCGAMILRRTAKDNGGLCTACAKLGPDLRAQRSALAAAVTSGAAFCLTPQETASATALIQGLPAADHWQIDPDDTFQTAGKTPADILAMIAAGAKPALYLRAADAITLTLDTRGPFAVLVLAGTGTRVSTGVCRGAGSCKGAGALKFAHGPMAATSQIPQDQHVFSTRPCCGDAMEALPSKFHLPRDAAVAGVRHILAGTSPAHLRWITSDVHPFTRAGHG